MTYYASRIERLRVIQESSFCADMSGNMTPWSEVPFHEGTLSLQLMRNVQTPLHAQQRLGGYPTGVLMPKQAKLNFECNLETFTTKATSTVAATSHWLPEMLEVALGGTNVMTGTAITTGATTTSLPVSVATTLRPGAAVGLVNTAGALEVREIESKSGSTLTLKHALSNAPAGLATVYGSTTIFYHTRMTGADSQSLQFACEGQNVEDRWLVSGGALDSIAITTTPNTIPKLSLGWKFVDWDQADGAATAGDLTGSVLGASTYTNTNTLVQADSEFRVVTVGTSSISGTLIEASSIEFRPNISWMPVVTSSGINTVKQWVKVHAAPVITGTFVCPYEDAQTWFDARTNKTLKNIWLQIGSLAADGAVLISVPDCQITDVQRTDVSGVAGQTVSFQSKLDTDTTAESSFEALAESPFRIAFL